MSATNDILEIASDTRSGVVDGVAVMFRAYIAQDRTERLVWRIGDMSGNRALFDKCDAIVILPQGREIIHNGRETHYLNIPRWLADALMNDFAAFDTESIAHQGISEAERPRYKGSSSDDESDEFTPMFEED